MSSTTSAEPAATVPTAPAPASRHFAALDGLRGVAILFVVVFHVFNTLKWKSGGPFFLLKTIRIGWIGVDIFFVLSGFLISGILLDALGARNYFRNFYARRFLRIIPVYYLLLAVVFIGFRWIIPFDTPQMQRLLRNQGWLWSHTTNWGFVYGTIVEHKPMFTITGTLDLTHLWTLAVEEQFYLFWPLLIFFLKPRALKMACLACVVGAVLLRLILWRCGARFGAMYFPTPCRLDGLALGSLLAILFRSAPSRALLLVAARIILPFAAALLGLLIFLRGGLESSDGPCVVFGVLLVEIIAACAIVFSIVPPAPLLGTRMLLLAPLRTLGKYSYGLYLIHCTILYPMQYRFPSARLIEWTGSELAGNMLYAVLFFALSFLLAFISWHAYEKHWLRLKRFFPYSSESAANRADL